jgi:pimeloyl-ACP methyl ester carboxylesterase
MRESVARYFATIGQRQVHYRRAGKGAPVVLLHQSPASSEELLPLIEHLAQRFAVVAPDMPGYGASDPLTPLTMEALVENLAAFVDALAMPAFALYGLHTGASLAIAFARRHPRRVLAVVAEGLLCLEETERTEFIERYVEPFVPRWDGSHLAWVWSRLKDQSVFFPWYDRSSAARLGIDAATSTVLCARARDWLRSGEHYGQAYAAAMRYEPRADLCGIGAPFYIVCQAGDPLAQHLARLPSLPASCHVEIFADGAVRHARLLEIFSQYCAGRFAPERVPTRPIEGALWQDYVGAPGAQVRVLRSGSDPVRPVVIQHGAQGSVRECRGLLAGFAATRSAVAVEIPGHGESDSVTERDAIEPLTERLAVTLKALDIDAYDFVGMGAGAAIGVHMLHVDPEAVRSLTLVAPLELSHDAALRTALIESYSAPAVDSYGGYLLKAWHEVRDHQLFFPWFERRRVYGADAPLLDPRWLQARTVDLLASASDGVALRRAELMYPLLQRLAESSLEPLVAAPLWEPRFAQARTLATRAGRFVALPRNASDWAGEIRAAHDQ